MESGVEEEWEMVDYYPPLKEGKETSKLQLGWVIDAGKKVLIGGVVVLSLPFILPPLVVILTLGLALSVPYGVVLASYACTNNLMTKLLPSPSHQDAGFEDFKGIDNEFDGYGRDDEISREEREGYEGNLDIIVNDDDVVAKNVEIGGGVNEEEKEKKQSYMDVVKTEEGENEKIMVTKGEERQQKEEEGENEKIMVTKGEEEGEKLVQENNGEVEKVVTEKGSENLVQEKKDEQVEKMNKEISGKRRRKKKNIGGKSKEAPQNVELDVEEANVVTVQDDSGPGLGGTLKYYESTTIIADGMELKEEKDILHSQDQEQEAFGDEKIWEKIDAIREISGFKAPRRDSYYDELKALYLFTGIEAPSTSSDTPPDFAEFYSKLCFLMTVIGLK